MREYNCTMSDKRELHRSLLSGEASVEEFTFQLHWSNGAITGVCKGDKVVYDDPSTGETKTATKTEFERLAGKYLTVRADILNPISPIIDESQIPDI
jgi:hypothetical protein